jgi:hypothetical protein
MAKRARRTPEPIAATPAPVPDRIPELDPLPGLVVKPTYLVSEVAYYFSCSPGTVRMWCAHARINAIETPGGAKRITRDSLVSWANRIKEQRLR